MDQKLFAFWEYNGYPGFLGAEVIKMRGNGYVEVRGYQGMAFNPVKILPLAEGVELAKKLRDLGNNYSRELEQFNLLWKQKVDVLMK